VAAMTSGLAMASLLIVMMAFVLMIMIWNDLIILSRYLHVSDDRQLL